MSAIRILLADDHPFFRDGVRLLLDATADTSVVGEASTGAEAVRVAVDLTPAVILMDINMPELNGIEAARQIVAANPAIGVLMVTMYDDDDSVLAALRAGARGYVLKGANQAELLRAIRAVAAGDAVFGPTLARRIIGYFSAPRPTVPWQPFPELTDREREVLTLIAQRKSNAEIADSLFLSAKTVRNYISTVFSKLQVADRAEAIARAREAGMGEG